MKSRTETIRWSCLLFLVLTIFVASVELQRRGPNGGGQSRGGPQQPQSEQNRPQSPAPSRGADEEDSQYERHSEADKVFTCPKSDGLYADPNSCRKFNLCGNWKAWTQTCPSPLYFDSKLKFCTFKSDQLTCGLIDEADIKAEEKILSQEALPICNANKCHLPDCFCTVDGTLIPGNIPLAQTPQMVLISFSGALNALVFDHYRKILGYGSKFSTEQSRKNPNGCGIKATFFINHEYSNYAQIQWFAAQEHEIAMHSITHRTPETWWTDAANYSDWAEEMIGMREILLSNSAGSVSKPVLTRENVIGMRAPFIRPGGDQMFEMAHDFGLLYDSSIAAPRGTPPYWPFTFDYRQPFDCSNQVKKTQNSGTGPEDRNEGQDFGGKERTAGRQRFGRRKRSTTTTNEQKTKLPKKETFVKKSPKHVLQNNNSTDVAGKSRVRRQTSYLGRGLKCPTKAFNGLWEVPLNPLFDEYNTCHHADQCVFTHSSDEDDVEAIVDFLRENFERHYNSNRAPFQLNFHVNWFTQKRNVKALNQFLDHLFTFKDVWFTTYQEMLSWVKNPRPTSETEFKCSNANHTQFACNRPHTCVIKHYLTKDNNAASEDSFSRSDTRYMPVCHASLCPQQYQWYGNSAGKRYSFKTIMQLIDEAPPLPAGSQEGAGQDGAGNDRPGNDGPEAPLGTNRK